MPSLGRFGLRPGPSPAADETAGAAFLKPATIIEEIAYPLTETAVVLALVTFVLLQMLAEAAGLLGIWLGIVVLPAYFRYLLALLEARANGRKAPVPGIELFNWVENFWSLFPLVLIALWIWGEYYLLATAPAALALVPGALILALLPASMAVLALTRAPLESLNPIALLAVVKACGRDYLLVPAVVVCAAFVIQYLARRGAPEILIRAGSAYVMFVLFTLTGRILREHAVELPVPPPDEREPDPARLRHDLIRGRSRVLDHAYGFVSRGNRRGGLDHIRRWIDGETDPDAASRWFIDQMLQWESNEAALLLAQTYLKRLLSEQRDVEALKLIARCQLESERFRPLPEDTEAALAAALRLGNRELAERLRGFGN